MKTPFALLRECAPALVIFLLLTLFSAVTVFGQSDPRVVIKGRLVSPPDPVSAPYACLVAANGEEMEVVIRPNGRFWVNAPEKERYVLQFARNGCITKQVVIDAHHAAKGVKGSKDRVIEFDVVLHRDDSEGRLKYDGAVGNIAFHHSNGRMKVAHHYELVEKQAPDLAAGSDQ